MRKVICWDIDGTLLTTGKAGIFAYEEAVLELHQIKVNLWDLETAGLIDPEIARAILELINISPSDRAVEELLREYGKRLSSCLHRKKGKVMDGVVYFLEKTKARNDISNMLLTGNILEGAYAKLKYYGIFDYFHGIGAFSDGMRSRADIAKKALEIAKEKFKVIGPEAIYIIGDTPYDILCGKEIRAKTIAVASGKYSTEDLKKYNPDLVKECIDQKLLELLI